MRSCLARSAFVVELATLAGVWLVFRADAQLGSAGPVVVSALATAAIAAVAAVTVRRGRLRGSAGELALLAMPLSALAAVALVLSRDVNAPEILIMLPVLAAGPWAWITVLPGWSSRWVRLVVSLLAVPVLGFAAFWVGVLVTPLLLLSALLLLLLPSAYPSRGRSVPWVVVLATAAGAEMASRWLGSSLPEGPAFPFAVLFVVLLVGSVARPSVSRFGVSTGVLLAAVAVDLLFVTAGAATGGDFGARVVAGVAFGHLGVLAVAGFPPLPGNRHHETPGGVRQAPTALSLPR